MQEFRIFTEGKSDIKFIEDYISELFGVNLSRDQYFDTLGSWSGYKNEGILKQSIRLNHDEKKQTILILDADNDYAQRKEEVIKDFKDFEVPFSLFLFPNNAANGNLEVLLSQITVETKLTNCFEAYEQCIQGYHLPVDKAKIFAYLEALLPPKNRKGDHKDLIQPENRNYRNPAHWNLRHEYLQPLRDFLSPLFVESN